MPSLPDLATCKKIGFIVPSSNAAVEPITQAIFQSLNSNIICIFTRIKVLITGTDPRSVSQFSSANMLAAAQLLADAEPDAILWNGTSGMWVGGGLEADKQLAEDMQDATGIPCSTTTLATIAALESLKARKISIAVPYNRATTKKTMEFFQDCGYQIERTHSLDQTPETNVEIAKTSLKEVELVISSSSTPDGHAIVVACTNWPASGLVEMLESQLGGTVVIVDSIIVTAWWALRMIGYKDSVPNWGKLMREHL